MAEGKQFVGNDLVGSFPLDVHNRLAPALEQIEVPLWTPLIDPYQPIKYIHFPMGSIASLVASTHTGVGTEIGLIGSEGAVGTEVLLGSPTSPFRSMIQAPGMAYRIDVNTAINEFKLCGPFHDLILLFRHKLWVQVSRTTLCNLAHTIDLRMARWLLMCHDRTEGDMMQLTHSFLAMMLGASRVTVTLTVNRLQELGLIKSVRGKITILDRRRLEENACDCYAKVKIEYDRPYKITVPLNERVEI
jgi:hypothetical protein